MATDPLIENDQIICDLRDALRDGASGLAYVPRLLKRVLETDAWRERIDRTSRKPVPFRTFAEFVTTPATEGLGADIALVQRIVRDDPETEDLLDRALQGRHGGDRRSETKTDNSSLERDPNGHGTSRAYALRRLRKDAPALHADVLAGRLTAHAAMVQAGFRPPTFTVRADDPRSIADALRKRLDPDTLHQLADLLTRPS